ncbi:conserved protein of unknown function [Pseudomonas sp. JV551A1]|uniref:Uncharacterized protein n=1 Tax=Pseudomonas inefficax TaxID=2078786 RepID=A0AAQ1PE03_9PSED|nr:conserved protein of unknown function [Pseudomonas sp. JV551A1]SPO64245.1 conserved protein of unknown function [Pseudomonas inefficax]
MPIIAMPFNRVGFFAGLPAPTGIAPPLKAMLYLWERASPRRSPPRSNRPQPTPVDCWATTPSPSSL